MKAVSRAYLMMVLLLSAALAQSSLGSFQYVKQTDPLNDAERSYILTTESRNAQRAAQLQFRCQENNRSKQTDLYVVLKHNLKLPAYYSSYGRVFWQYRFDSKTASAEWTSYFSRDQSLIYLTDDARASFIEQAKVSQRLVVVITGDEIDAQTYQFNLEKFSEALAKLKCKVQPQ